MLDGIDPFGLKEKFDYFNFWRDEVETLARDARFLRVVRRAIMPIPGLDPGRELDTNVFPPLKVEPHPVLAGKRVALCGSGGSASLVTLCGIKRALEEAEVDLCAVSLCSGSAIWGSLIAAGFDAQQMVDTCFDWTASDLVDFDWSAVADLARKLGKGFVGLSRGVAIERAIERAVGPMALGETPIPCWAIVLNLDTNELEFFGPHHHGEASLARVVRTAVALPLFVQPVRFGKHHYVDGGTVNIFPLEPLLELDPPVDYVIGVNAIMPPGFSGENIEGFEQTHTAIFRASRQLYHVQWLEMARRVVQQAGDKLILLEPLPYSEITGSKFFEIFLDNSTWPAHVRTAYEDTKRRLAQITA
ncbi:MAG: patatin-like phospholipase family protein [Deltaproteobacteria bacterium]|nr:patatin-like phospholipase family protein [Deltaproteobacteria bacterium]MBW2534765.1 patatin-like phospholipase family protein [Deltaproteobacteria bacterium]